MSTNKESRYERTPRLLKSEVIRQEPIFSLTFLSAIISTSALPLNNFYYSWEIAEAHLRFIYEFNNAQWKKSPSLLKYLFLRMQKYFPKSLMMASPLHITCLNYITCPRLNQLLPRELELVYPEAQRRKVARTKSSLWWPRQCCKLDVGKEQTHLHCFLKVFQNGSFSSSQCQSLGADIIAIHECWDSLEECPPNRGPWPWVWKDNHIPKRLWASLCTKSMQH